MATIPAGLSVGDWHAIRRSVALRAVTTRSFNPKMSIRLWKLHAKLATISSPKSKPKKAGCPEALPGAEG